MRRWRPSDTVTRDVVICLVCSAACCHYAYFSGCDPLNPRRPPLLLWRESIPVDLASASFSDTVLLPSGRYSRKRPDNSVQQLSLFGGA